ncbi:protein C8orf37 homolog isoform X2 [Homarus americanus]|uniref:Cilia- and flagella-associated protein 418 n=1 Tax=Homarus americanus TaxID=6706 RepID=A0A8J5K109_HOMAM|nr:protein C8orf37 homolog isoform X2 [Homarus americanus]KAG7166226.1 C8orf37-like [Homarus americanus]
MADMADDIDDLLDEVEESFENSKLRTTDVKSESAKTDDLKDLLEEFEPPPRPLSTTDSPNTLASQPGGGSNKCSTPYLSGTTLPEGISTGTILRACDKLRCVDCDSYVVMIDGFTWTKETNYLFLRDNYPNVSRLRARLDSQRGVRAYACQCRHRSAKEKESVNAEKNLKWVCGGH